MKKLLSFLLLSTAVGCSSPEVREITEPGDPRFEWFQSLPGTWISTEDSSMAGTEVTYRLTSGGTVLEEVIDPGSDHEMVTMIHPHRQGLYLTHYCAIGNQPRMRAEPAKPIEEGEASIVDFRCDGGTNMREEDMHMHRAVFTFFSEDHIQAAWTMVQDGEKIETRRIDLVRKS